MTENKNVLWKKRAMTALAMLVAVGLLLTTAPNATAGMDDDDDDDNGKRFGELRVFDDRRDRLHDPVVTCDFWVAGLHMPAEEGILVFLEKDDGIRTIDRWEANDQDAFVNGPYEFEPGHYLVVALARDHDDDDDDDDLDGIIRPAQLREHQIEGDWFLAAKPVKFEVEECLTPCPTGLETTALRDGSILVTFDPAVGSEGSRVYRWVDDADPMLVAELGEGVDEYLDENTTGGVTYTYMVTGLFEGGRESEDCDTAKATALVPPPEPEPEPECPPVNVGATANQDGSITVNVDTDASYQLVRTGDGQTVNMGAFAGDQQVVDTDTVVGTTYTYTVLVDGLDCGSVQVTAIPVFPSALGALAAGTAGLVAYVGLRRRL